MADVMNRCIMDDERQWALGHPERFISVKPTQSAGRIETNRVLRWRTDV